MRTAAPSTEHARRSADAGFDYTIESIGDVTNVRLKGSLDVRGVSTFTRDFDARRSAGMRRVIFDCGDLEWVDAAGIGVFITLFRRYRFSNKGTVQIARLFGQPRDIFRLLRLDRVFDIAPELDAAHGSFTAPATI